MYPGFGCRVDAIHNLPAAWLLLHLPPRGEIDCTKIKLPTSYCILPIYFYFIPSYLSPPDPGHKISDARADN